MAAVILASGLLALGTLPLLAPQELNVLVHERNFAGFEYLLETAHEFEAQHPGVTVRVLSSASAAGANEKVKFMLAGGLPLDVTWIDITEFAAFLSEGVLLDLQPYFDADPDWHPEEYFEAPLEAMRDSRGHLYGLASTFTPYVLYVNRSLLQSEGLSVPAEDWTWNDLLRIGRSVTRDRDGDGRIDQWGISLTQWLQAMAPWIWQNGGRFLNEDGRCALDEPAAIEAVEFLVRLLHEEGIASDDATFENQFTFGLFQAGRTAFYGPVGYWETYRFKEIEDFEWDVIPLPRHRHAATSVAMRFYVVPHTSRHPRLAYAFVRALAGDTMQRGLARIGNGVPGLKRAAYSEDFLKPAVPPDSEQVFLDVMEHARFMPVLANWREIEALTRSELQNAILLGKLEPAEACRRVTAKANAFLDREAALQDRPKLGAETFLAAQVAGGVFLLWIFWRCLRGLRDRAGRLVRREERVAWLCLSPWALSFSFLILGPALVMAVLALTEWSPIRDLGEARWVGTDQFARLWSDDTFHDSLWVTARYAVLAVPLQLLMALGLALVLQRRLPGIGVLRTVFYLPTILSPVILGAIWRWMFAKDGGLLQRGFEAMGLSGPNWLGDPAWIVPAFVIMSLWTVGVQMLVFLSGLQSVDPSLHEAARVDGAGALRRLWHVSLPAIGPMILFNAIVGLINAFQLFAQPFVMTQGGPGNESRFLVLYLYEQGFRFMRMGYASTLAWVLFAVILLLSLVILRGSSRFVHYAGGGR